MIKVFVSMPMHAFTDDQICEQFVKAHKWCNKKFREEVQIIDTFNQVINQTNMTPTEIRLNYLGESIKRMGSASIIVMYPGWQRANGCRSERVIAENYRIPILYIDEEDLSDL